MALDAGEASEMREKEEDASESEETLAVEELDETSDAVRASALNEEWEPIGILETSVTKRKRFRDATSVSSAQDPPAEHECGQA